MTTVETRIQDEVLTAIENIVSRRIMEWAMKSVNASSGRSVDGNVLELYQRDFLGNIEGLQRTARIRINSRTDLNRMDETRGKITIEGGDLLVVERNLDRQTHIHQNHFYLFLKQFVNFLNNIHQRKKTPWYDNQNMNIISCNDDSILR